MPVFIKYFLLSIVVALLGLTPVVYYLRSGIRFALDPLTYGILSLSQKIQHEALFWGNLRDLEKQNIEKDKKILDLQSKEIKLVETQKENEVLREQLELKPLLAESRLILSHVVGWDASGSKNMIINVGLNEGVEMGDPVVLYNILVGQVTAVTATSSHVLLIFSPDFKVVSYSQNNRVSGTVSGSWGTTLKMDHILQSDVLDPGEPILTSGLDPQFPKGFLVGHVFRVVGQESDKEKSAELEFPISIKDLEIVFVWKKH